MAKVIEFDIDNEDDVWDTGDPDSFAGGEAPKPGVYRALIQDISPGKSKADKPLLVVQADLKAHRDGSELTAEDSYDEDAGSSPEGYRFWERLSFSKAAEWKMAQFLKAIGEGSEKKNKGKFDAEKHEGETMILVRVKKAFYEEQYRPELSAMWHISLADEDAGGNDDAAEAVSLDDDDEDGFEDDGFDDEFGDEDEDEELTYEDLENMTSDELKALAKEHKISLKGVKSKGDAVAKIADGLDIEDEVPF